MSLRFLLDSLLAGALVATYSILQTVMSLCFHSITWTRPWVQHNVGPCRLEPCVCCPCALAPVCCPACPLSPDCRESHLVLSGAFQEVPQLQHTICRHAIEVLAVSLWLQVKLALCCCYRRAASSRGEARDEVGSRPCQADMWMGALTTVAVAVLLMILGSGKARLRPSTAT